MKQHRQQQEQLWQIYKPTTTLSRQRFRKVISRGTNQRRRFCHIRGAVAGSFGVGYLTQTAQQQPQENGKRAVLSVENQLAIGSYILFLLQSHKIPSRFLPLVLQHLRVFVRPTSRHDSSLNIVLLHTLGGAFPKAMLLQMLVHLSSILLFFSLLCTISRTASGACSTSIVLNGNTKTYATCSSLTNWAHLSWTFDPSSRTLDTMFRALATSSSGWVGWGINFGASPAMAGSNVLLGFRDSSNVIRLAQYKLTGENIRGTPPTPGSGELNVASNFIDISSSVVTIFAKITLPTNQSTASLNLVYSRGPGTTTNLSPLPHSADPSFLKDTTAIIDLSTNQQLKSRVPHQTLKNQHGILNAVGWGIFLPLGVMVARYLRPYKDPEWFYTHISLQSLGYILGAAGWGLGLKLGGNTSASQVHQNIGTSIFIFATLQVISLVFRPDKDHKVRFYWNIYHHGLGYLTLILIFTNIYKGFKLLRPPQTLQNLYTAFLVLVILASAGLEAYRWYVYAEEKKKRPAYALDSPTSDSKI